MGSLGGLGLGGGGGGGVVGLFLGGGGEGQDQSPARALEYLQLAAKEILQALQPTPRPSYFIWLRRQGAAQMAQTVMGSAQKECGNRRGGQSAWQASSGCSRTCFPTGDFPPPPACFVYGQIGTKKAERQKAATPARPLFFVESSTNSRKQSWEEALGPARRRREIVGCRRSRPYGRAQYNSAAYLRYDATAFAFDR